MQTNQEKKLEVHTQWQVGELTEMAQETGEIELDLYNKCHLFGLFYHDTRVYINNFKIKLHKKLQSLTIREKLFYHMRRSKWLYEHKFLFLLGGSKRFPYLAPQLQCSHLQI